MYGECVEEGGDSVCGVSLMDMVVRFGTYVCTWENVIMDSERRSSVARVTALAAATALGVLPHSWTWCSPLGVCDGRQRSIIA